MVREEPLATIIQDALEDYASGRLDGQAEVKRFFEAQPAFPKDLPKGEIRQQKVTGILTRVLYAGCIEAPDQGVSLRKGHHEGLISLATYARIQERRAEGTKAAARPDIRADFPLRGFGICADCGYQLDTRKDLPARDVV